MITKSEAQSLLAECTQTHSWMPLINLMSALIEDLPDEKSKEEVKDSIIETAIGLADGTNLVFELSGELEGLVQVIGGPVDIPYKVVGRTIIFEQPPLESPIVKITKE